MPNIRGIVSRGVKTHQIYTKFYLAITGFFLNFAELIFAF